MRKGERLALFIVVILFSIALGLSAMLAKIGYDSFVAAREAKEAEEAEEVNRWRDVPRHGTKDPVDPDYVQPMNPDAGPQGTNPDNADYGGGSNVHNDTKKAIEPDFDSESDEWHQPPKEYPESGHKEPDPPKKEYSEPDPSEFKQPYMEEYSDPDTGERKTGIVITGDKEDHVDRAEKVEKDPPLVESGTSQGSSAHDYTDGMFDTPE